MRHFRSAFSLVELSIVLAILGVVTAGGLTVGTTLVEQQANVASNANLDEINKALQDYYRVNGFLPCPASRTVALGAAGLGTATNCGGAAPAGVVDTGSVRIGALPVRALGMRDRQIADEFGNRYIYAVTENHAIDRTTFDNVANAGAITVQDGGGATIASDVSYYVTSTGSDGKGAYRFQTAAVTTACGATANLDVESCDDDAIFRDTRFNNGSVAGSFYDDFPRWLPKFRLVGIGSTSGASLWSNTADTIFSVGSDGNTVTGSVGIGTMSPDYKLTIQHTDAAISMKDSGGTTRAYLGIAGIDGAATANALRLRGDSGIMFSIAGAPVMTMTTLNNVGIGTTTPGNARLYVQSNLAADWGARFYNSSGTGYGIYSEAAGYGFYGKTTVAGEWASRGDSQDGLNIGGFGVANAYGVYGVTSRAGGYIGVYGVAERTGSPAAGATNGYGVYGWGNTNNSIGVRGHVPADVTGGYGLYAAVAGASNYGALIQNTAAGYYCYIGYLNTHALWCSGPSRFMGNLGIQGAPGSDALTVNGDVLANNYYLTSDARLKHDITPAFAETGLKILEGLKPVHFTWNKNDKKDLGVIAQDVEKVFPQAVSVDDKGFRRVAYDKLVLPVITAVKELHKRVTDLMSRLTRTEDRVAEIEKENAALKARIERLERQIEGN
jgi:prepilin-type N-terminal cleavage/methylation domain-containing protein